MPEVWLPYGGVEVAVEVKAENLMGVLHPKPLSFKRDEWLEALKILPEEGRIILATDSSTAFEALKGLPRGWVVSAPRPLQAIARRWCEQVGLKWRPLALGEAGPVEGIPLQVPKGAGALAFLAETRFDPVFGFDGGPAALLSLSPAVLMEALQRHGLEQPTPGVHTPARSLAERVVGELGEVRGVEVVEVLGEGGAVVGNLWEAHERAVALLRERGVVSLERRMKMALIAPGGGRHDATLAASLRALWNTWGAMRAGSDLVMVAECGEGLGSEALRDAALHRLSLKPDHYIEGWEDAVLLQRSLASFHITLVSTLPLHYVQRGLGLAVTSSVQEAAQGLLERGGRSKMAIIPRGNETLMKAA